MLWRVALSDAGEQETCPDERADGGNKQNRGPPERGAGVRAIYLFRIDDLWVLAEDHESYPAFECECMAVKRRQSLGYSFTKSIRVFPKLGSSTAVMSVIEGSPFQPRRSRCCLASKASAQRSVREFKIKKWRRERDCLT